MNIRTLLALCMCVVVLLLQACSSSDDNAGASLASDARPDSSRPTSSTAVAVFNDFIATQRTAPVAGQTVDSNLLINSGFENGLNGWTACQSGAISSTSNSYEGTGALALNGQNCVFQTIEAVPGQSYSLSCFVELAVPMAWTGMGMTFSTDDFTAISEAPAATATSTSYAMLETVATAPASAGVIGVWVYSDHGATVDSCMLTLAENRPQAEIPDTANVLKNSTFSAIDNANNVDDWLTGCGGTVIADGSSLYLADGACSDQSLSLEAVKLLSGSTSRFTCDVSQVQGYSDMSVYLDHQLVGVTTIESLAGQTSFSVDIPATPATNGFVTLYSEGNMRVDNCQFSIADGGIATTPVVDTPDTPPVTDTTDTTPVTDTPETTDTSPATDTPETTDTTPVTDTTDATDAAPVTDTTDTTDTTPVTETTDTTDTTPVTATYRVTFNSTWSAQRHPTAFPGNPHFSPLTGAVHNSQVEFWTPGSLSTPGVTIVAETGNPMTLIQEVNSAVTAGTAKEAVTGGGIAESPGTVSVEFEVSSDFPLVSLASMVAPSPDWFVGVHSVALFDGTSFIDTLRLELPVYDAGTDSGVSYTSGDLPTVPVSGISRLSSNPADSSFVNGLPTAGQLVFQRLQ